MYKLYNAILNTQIANCERPVNTFTDSNVLTVSLTIPHGIPQELMAIIRH